MIPLPHSSGPPAMPTPVKGCAICVRLDKARQAARKRGDQSAVDKYGSAVVAHHLKRHRGVSW
ncbi:hypothetical protein [Streptomyces caatingaensis]|uniref:Uncharacterized protein n=1 Tax=Streptomyces caatingaensis TaxID=1678637 RepID=A0A0K9XHM1_9ACTN|nr:hypothetical protein [Streptomyces caatingaensis]KNB52885.1 hypothetical protein AC230_09650 [Streptomyces caatingaensis]